MPDDTPIYNELVEKYFGYQAVECVHGLSLWLCADPVMHYPPDNHDDEGWLF